MELSRALARNCETTALVESANPRGSPELTGRRASLTIPGQLRSLRVQVMNNYKIDVGADHLLMGWRVQNCSGIQNRLQMKSAGRKCCKNTRDKDYDSHHAQFGEMYLV